MRHNKNNSQVGGLAELLDKEPTKEEILNKLFELRQAGSISYQVLHQALREKSGLGWNVAVFECHVDKEKAVLEMSKALDFEIGLDQFEYIVPVSPLRMKQTRIPKYVNQLIWAEWANAHEGVVIYDPGTTWQRVEIYWRP